MCAVLQEALGPIGERDEERRGQDKQDSKVMPSLLGRGVPKERAIEGCSPTKVQEIIVSEFRSFYFRLVFQAPAHHHMLFFHSIQEPAN